MFIGGLPIPALFTPRLGPVVDLDFVNDPVSAVARITCVRPSGAGDFGPAGSFIQYAPNVPRIGYDPVTLARRGLLVEEQRKNVAPNPRGEGGSGSTAAGGWSVSTPTGVSVSWSTFSEAGIPGAALTFSGTATASGNIVIAPVGPAAAAAATGQTWTFAPFIKLPTGTLPATITAFFNENTSSGSLVKASSPIAITQPGTATISGQRPNAVYTTSGGGTVANLQAGLQVSVNSGQAVSFTLWVFPQPEQGAFATSPIMPPAGSPAATTRAVDQAYMPLSMPSASLSLAVDFVLLSLNNANTNTNPRLIGTSDGSNNNLFELYTNPSGPFQTAQIIYAGASSQIVRSDGMTAGAVQKMALSAGASSGSLAFNGMTSSAAVQPTPAMTRIDIGNRWDGARPFSGYFRRARLWPRALSATELQQVTT